MPTPSEPNPFKPGDKVLNPHLLEFGIPSVLTVVRSYKNGNVVARKPGIEICVQHSVFTRAEEAGDD